MPPLPSFTKTWHNASYDAISPTRPALSVAGKTVVITGGGRGLGSEIARAHAAAGASRIALIGRTESSLSKTRDAIAKEFTSTTVSYHVADTTDEMTMQQAAEGISSWDILILNAGLLKASTPIASAPTSDWWRVFETNVKGALITAQAFLPTRSQNASIVGISADFITVPVSVPSAQGQSAYTCSKLAQTKMFEFLAAENPDVFVVSVHPGIVQTDMVNDLFAGQAVDPSILDDIHLPAHFLVWVTSNEARFLKGRYVCANWDVEELKAKAKTIETSNLLTASIHGWPYTDV